MFATRDGTRSGGRARVQLSLAADLRLSAAWGEDPTRSLPPLVELVPIESMDRCAVLVDAGYLLGAGGSLLGRDLDRARLEVDHAELVRELLAEAQARTGLPVLRLLWYDGAFEARPTSEHRVLSVLPDVKVRLGVLVKRNGRVQQKGVDSYLHRDLITLARNHATADLVLLGGDEDLRRAVEEAQDLGARVHLWGVQAADPEFNQSPALIAEADRRWVIPADWITRFVRLRPETSGATIPVEPPQQEQLPPETPITEPAAPAPVPASAPAMLPASAPSSVPEPRPAPPQPEPVQAPGLATPADLARLAAHHREHAPADSGPEGRRGWTVRYAGDDLDVPRLSDLTNPAQQWQDNEYDATAAGRTAVEVGATYGRRWAARVAPADLAAVADQHPRRLPRRLDGELLRYAERQGIDTWAEDETAKRDVRAGFWQGLDNPADDLPDPVAP